MSSLVGNTTNLAPTTSSSSHQGQTFDSGATSSRIKKYSSIQQRFARGRSSSSLTLAHYLSTRKWTTYANVNLGYVARNHPPFMQRLDYMKRLPVHEGCVNTICWNKTGEYLLSGSDDCNLCITKPGYLFDSSQEYTVLHKVQTHHLGNIFSAQFLHNTGDRQIVSCSSEGPIIVHDINSTDPSEGLLNFNCHSETIFEVITVPDDDKVFLSCGEDKTIRLFDMRVHNSCARAGTCPHPALIRNSHAMTTLTLHPLNSNLMLVGRADGLGLVYDRRKLPDVTKFTREQAHSDRLAGVPSQPYRFKHPLEGVVAQFSVPNMDEKYRFTSLCYNKDGTEVLASYSGDYIYLFSHDKSSNFELIQTLPKKISENSNVTSRNDDSDNGDDNEVRPSQTWVSTTPSTGQTRPADPIRGARISRIRVRGDWSDTGVNSVPHSNRQQDGDDTDTESRRPSFLERVAVSLNARHRFVPITEIIAGPISGIGSNPSRQTRTIEEEGEEQEEDEDEDEDKEEDEEEEVEDVGEANSGDESDNCTLIDDDDAESSERNMNSDDEMENFERFAAITVENLMDEATEQASHRVKNDESTNTNDDRDRRDKSSSSSAGKDVAGKKGQSKISSETKEKFKRTLNDLKSKYSNITTFKPRIKYQGHRNSRTSIKEAIFWSDDYIMSGSDCGRILVWEKKTAKIVMAFKADERVVNCLAPNPYNYVLASSGIDYDIKLWSTQSLKDGPLKVSDDEMKKIVDNNELMLEESKQTLSVPPHLFFRVLASLVQSSR